MSITNDQIRTRPNPDCHVCGARGVPLYRHLRDRLFGVSGEWDLKKCSNSQCGLVWLDPMPIEEDIGKAYLSYYTHAVSGDGRRSKSVKDIFKTMLAKGWELFLCATPIYRERKQTKLMYLGKNKPGKLLEIGCGNGRRLTEFRAAGWQVEGQEVDLNAVKAAQGTYGLKVHLGTIDELKIPDETFDAIIMNHVIEHVPHPDKLIVSCRKLLKSGGELVVVTPNIESLGHRCFGVDWRGLEPPRHLHIFSCKALEGVAHLAGFSQYTAFTTAANAQTIAIASLDMRRTGYHKMGSRHTLGRHIAAILFQLWAMIFRVGAKESGEECVLKAKK